MKLRSVGTVIALVALILLFQNCGQGFESSIPGETALSSVNLGPPAQDPTCPTGEHREGGVCSANTRACTITNGTGEQVWNGSGYNTCVLRACTAPFVKVETACYAPYVVQSGSLRHFANLRGLAFGTAFNYNQLINPAEPQYQSITHTHYNTLTPENEMKWSVLRPTEATYDFTRSDAVVNFAARHGMKVRGHALVWHMQNPAWLTNGTFTPAQKQVLLEQHITTVMRHYRDKYPGTVKVWDVVNESFEPLTAVYRNTVWSNIGATPDEYIKVAFRAARAADPSAILTYNDFYNETANPKSDAIFAMIQRMKAEGVPIDAVGIQAHLSSEYGVPTVADMRANIQRYAAIGVQVHFTEVDFRTDARDGISALENQRVANGYSNMIAACVAEPNCREFTTWGFTQKFSWIPGEFAGFVPSLPFDANYAPTNIFTILLSGID